MSNRTEKRIIGWLRNQIGIEKADGPIARFELRHLAGGKLGMEVLTLNPSFENGTHDAEDTWFDVTTSEIITAAEAEASEIGGSQVYAIFAYRHESPSKVSARCVFRVDGGDPEESSYGEMNSEPATPQGIIKQSMRHTEVLMKLMVTNQAAIMRQNAMTIEQLSRQVERHEDNRFQTIELVEDLLSKKLERDLEIQKAESNQKMLEEGVSSLKALAPAVISRINGGNGSLPSDTTSALKGFFESLSEQQKMDLLGSLNPAQQAALGELIQQINN